VKITNVEAIPVWGGDDAGRGRNYLFVVVDTDEGISGVGEAGITWKELAVAGCVEHFKPQLIGEDPHRIEHIWQVLSRGGFFPHGRIAGAAISAIDIALWDIKGKALGVPIYELLGGRVRDKVVCYPHNVGHGLEIESLVESCLRTKEEGWKFCRWGLPQNGQILEPNESIRASLKQFEAIRNAVGDEIELCFDVHTRLDPAEVVYFCKQTEQYRPFFIEDPIRSESMQSLRHVRHHTSAPLALGEQFASKWEFRQIIEEELTDYARIDLCIAGGISEAKKIAGWCETHYIKLAVHNPLGPVSSAACLQLNLACNNFGVQEQPRKPGAILPEVVPVQAEWKDGYLLAPTRPGLGIEFDRAEAKKRPYRENIAPQVRRLDGSFTNW
jgi:L-alanine-DL-glutamate epimerase-like enolase superfamily enzyme